MITEHCSGRNDIFVRKCVVLICFLRQKCPSACVMDYKLMKSQTFKELTPITRLRRQISCTIHSCLVKHVVSLFCLRVFAERNVPQLVTMEIQLLLIQL